MSKLNRHWNRLWLVACTVSSHGPLARYIKLRVAHAPGMPRTSSPPPRVSDPDMHHSTFVTHVPWCIPGSLNSGFLWCRWQGKRSRHFRRLRNPQFYESGKSPIWTTTIESWEYISTKTAIIIQKCIWNVICKIAAILSGPQCHALEMNTHGSWGKCPTGTGLGLLKLRSLISPLREISV